MRSFQDDEFLIKKIRMDGGLFCGGSTGESLNRIKLSTSVPLLPLQTNLSKLNDILINNSTTQKRRNCVSNQGIRRRQKEIVFHAQSHQSCERRCFES